MKQVGLTDDPDRSRREHGNPPDWWQEQFDSETAARQWAKYVVDDPNYVGGAGNGGWRYGYTYTITEQTVQ